MNIQPFVLIECLQRTHPKFGQIYSILIQWATDNELTIQKGGEFCYRCFETLKTGDEITHVVAFIDDRICEMDILSLYQHREPLAFPVFDRRLYLQTDQLYVFQDIVDLKKQCIYCNTVCRKFGGFCRTCDVSRDTYKQTTTVIIVWLAIADYVDLPRDLVLLIARTLDELALTLPCETALD